MAAIAKKLRSVHFVTRSSKMKEGGGFTVHRPFPTMKLEQYDPFLLLDHMGPVTYGPGQAVGAPWHPHRGFETVTYLLQGEMRHRDSMGSSGNLRPGDVQWMTAGSGIIHDEGPSEAMLEKGGTVEGFQIWVNLPSAKKMIDPYYQDINREKIPEVTIPNGKIKVIAGSAYGVKAVVNTTVPIVVLDVNAEKDSKITLDIPKEMNCLAYVYRGTGLFGPEKKLAEMFDTVFFEHDGDTVQIEVPKDLPTNDHNNDNSLKFLVLAGVPLNEPMARRGPFVLNTVEELMQAFDDYQKGKFVKHKAEMKSKTVHDTPYDPHNSSIL